VEAVPVGGEAGGRRSLRYRLLAAVFVFAWSMRFNGQNLKLIN
jgi:hypothetical protein